MNPDLLGIKSNNLDCSRSMTMLHLDTPKGKEAMDASKFQQDIGGTVA